MNPLKKMMRAATNFSKAVSGFLIGALWVPLVPLFFIPIAYIALILLLRVRLKASWPRTLFHTLAWITPLVAFATALLVPAIAIVLPLLLMKKAVNKGLLDTLLDPFKTLKGLAMFPIARRRARVANRGLLAKINDLPEPKAAIKLLSEEEIQAYEGILNKLKNNDFERLNSYRNFADSICPLSQERVKDINDPVITVEGHYPKENRHWIRCYQSESLKGYFESFDTKETSLINDLFAKHPIASDPVTKDTLNDKTHITFKKGFPAFVVDFVSDVREIISKWRSLHPQLAQQKSSDESTSGKIVEFRQDSPNRNRLFPASTEAAAISPATDPGVKASQSPSSLRRSG